MTGKRQEPQTIIRVVSRRAEVCQRCGALNLFRQRRGLRMVSENSGVTWARCAKCGHLAKIVVSVVSP